MEREDFRRQNSKAERSEAFAREIGEGVKLRADP